MTRKKVFGAIVEMIYTLVISTTPREDGQLEKFQNKANCINIAVNEITAIGKAITATQKLNMLQINIK